MTKRRFPILWLLLFGWLDGSEASNCSIPPVYVDMHHREVQGSRKHQYGSYVGVGTPTQNMSLWPSLSQNDTIVADFDFCKRSNLPNCSSSTGGSFDSTFSTTWNSSSVQTPGSGTIRNLTKLGKDTVHLFTHMFFDQPVNDVEITELPIAVVDEGPHIPGLMGLGSGSTLLNRLVELGKIASKSYSIYVGTGLRRAGGTVNGSTVLGGYDAARFKGGVHTYPMDLRSKDYLPVNVTDIILHHPTLQGSSIMDEESFQARITTDQYPMIFPVGIRRKWKAATGAEKTNHPDRSFILNDQSFNSSMTIVLSDGFNVTLPPHILRNQETGLSAVASYPANYSGTYYLSSAWLTQVYLMLDFEAQQFHLAKAVQQPHFIGPDILCPGDIPFSRQELAANEQSPVRNRPSLLGAILGGTFGGVAVLLIGWMCFLHVRRRRLAGDSEEGKLRHEPIMFFSDEELQHRRQDSMAGESTKTIELKRLPPQMVPVPPAQASAPVPATAKAPAPTREESTSPVAETEEPETDRDASLDLAAILRDHGSAAHSPTVLHSPTRVISRSVSPVSVMSTKSKEQK